MLTLMEMYVQGVSTRKVAQVSAQLCGTRFSKSLASALAGRRAGRLAVADADRTESPYVWVGARYARVRVDGRVISQGVLLATFPR